VPVDKRIYSKPAVLRACYWLSKDVTFRLEEQSDWFMVTMRLGSLVATLERPKVKSFDDILPEFFQSLLDQQLHVDIQAETASIRELIIAKAFAESGILEDFAPGTFDDPVSARTDKSTDLVQIGVTSPSA